MKNKQFLFSFLLVTILISAVFNSCKKEEPEPPTLVSLLAGTVDLNAATSATDIPVSPTITATFSVDIDPATATEDNITLIQDYDDVSIPIDITVDTKVITITPASDLGTGTLYNLTFSTGLKSTDGLALTEVERNFTTAGAFAPSGAIAHFTFEDNANDQIGSFDPLTADIIDITYTASRNTAAGKAATFNGTTSIIEVPNGDDLMNTANFSIAFWVKTNSTGKTTGHFVMGCAGWYGFQYELYGSYDGSKFAYRYELADHTTASEDMWFPSLADLGWQGWTYARSLTANEMIALLKDKWLNVVYTYNGSTKVGTLYFNGDKMKSFDFNLWPTTDAKKGVIGLKYNGAANGDNLALGFIQGRNNRTISDNWADYSHADATNHFKGQLDDIKIWHKVISANEIMLMYNSEKP